MKVLITGGGGFIGSHLCDALLKDGADVTVIDNFSTGSPKNIAHIANEIEVISGDIRDVALMDKLTEKTDLVLHMAAALGVSRILENTLESISTNITGSEVVLNAATKYNTRLIIASTSEIYGKNPAQPLSEGDDRVVGSPQKLRWSYSDAKAIEEAMAFAMHQHNKSPVTTVRLFNTVGPRQTGQYGMVVPRFVASALKNETITIYGTGEQSRVFCHVYDAVRGILLLAKTDSTIGGVFNLGGRGEITINELANKVIEVTKSASTISHTPYDDAYPIGFEDMQRRVPNISKITSAIDWQPEHSLENIINDVARNLQQAN
jgi:UDP-glucose 4-epimerase